jgi:hypothetical protein
MNEPSLASVLDVTASPFFLTLRPCTVHYTASERCQAHARRRSRLAK